MANEEIKKNAEENIVQKIIFSRVTTMVLFGGFLVNAIFWVSNPQKDLELRIALLEQKQDSDNELVLKIQNLKDNDIHEIHLANERLEEQVQKLSNEQAANAASINAKLDILMKQ